MPRRKITYRAVLEALDEANARTSPDICVRLDRERFNGAPRETIAFVRSVEKALAEVATRGLAERIGGVPERWRRTPEGTAEIERMR
jgi:hypothetical protein